MPHRPVATTPLRGRRTSIAAALAACLLLSACAGGFDPATAPTPSRRPVTAAAAVAAPPVSTTGSAVQAADPAPVAGPAPVIGLALGGGGPRGFAHVGVLEALDELGIHATVVAGTSVGAIVGSLYAAGYDGRQLRTISDQIGPLDVFDFAPFAVGGFITGARLEALVDRLVGVQAIEALPLRFAAVATDRERRSAVAIDSGPVGRAVRASSAVPGAFVPVRIDGRTYIDGDRSSPVPVQAARQLGASVVIAVDIFPDEESAEAAQASLTWRSYIRERRVRIEAELVDADIRIRPRLPHRMGMNRSYYDATRQAGYDAVQAMRPALCARLACRAPDTPVPLADAARPAVGPASADIAVLAVTTHRLPVLSAPSAHLETP